MLSNGQFFITLGADAAQLTGQFALIGQVTEGLEILDDFTRIVVGDPTAPEPDILQSIEITQN
jgi:cyclophilin family peptidyl-prolyl cis-trans isomerase